MGGAPLPTLRPPMRNKRQPLLLALLFSLLIHTLLLSLAFSGQTMGLPGLALPWGEWRVQVSELQVLLVPLQAQVVTPPPARAVESLNRLARTVAQPSAPLQAATESPPPPPPALPKTAEDAPLGVSAPAVALPALPEVAMPSAELTAPLRTRTVSDLATTPKSEALALARQQLEEKAPLLATPVAPLPMPVVPAAPAASSPEQLEEARIAAARLQAERLQAAARETAAREVALREAARQETARAEVERLAAARQAAARELAARQETARADTLRLEAARQEAARLEAERQAAARLEAAQLKAAQAEAERRDISRQEAARRAMGRQLDEEAARRQAAAAALRPPGTLPLSSSSARRGRLFGRVDNNAELVLYAETWARKIQLNMTFDDRLREAALRPHINPVVTVALRQDGSVESLVFVVTSGVAEIDEGIRRIVQNQAPYPAFSVQLAGEFDVIEIRRTWHFDTAVRLY